MRQVDLHPDDLLDRARSRELTPAEATRLRAHASECSACALELAWLADDLHERSPSEEDALRAQRAVRRAWGDANDESPLAALVTPRQPRWAVRSAPLLALGVLLSASAAAAAFGDSSVRWIVEHVTSIVGLSHAPANEAAPSRPRPSRTPPPPPPRSIAPVQPPAHVSRDAVITASSATSSAAPPAGQQPLAARRRARSSAPVAQARLQLRDPPIPRDEPGAAEQATSASKAVVAEPVAEQSTHDLRPPAQAQQLEQAAARGVDPPARPPPSTSDAAIARLREAQAARAGGDVDRALALYTSLERDFAGSRAERSSRVSRGRLLLEERRDAASALESFDRYLAGDAGGALAEEARLGRARALELLGERSRAARAWRELLQHHPRSIHASMAQTRLRELER